MRCGVMFGVRYVALISYFRASEIKVPRELRENSGSRVCRQAQWPCYDNCFVCNIHFLYLIL